MSEPQKQLPAGTANLPEHVRRGIDRVGYSSHADHIKAALRAVASGDSITAAAIEHGADREHLRELAHRYDLAHTQRILRGHARVAILGIEEIEARLADPVTRAAMRDDVLNFYVGTASDKLLKHEQIQATKRGSDANANIAFAIASLAASLPPGSKLAFGLEVGTSEHETITVEAETSET